MRARVGEGGVLFAQDQEARDMVNKRLIGDVVDFEVLHPRHQAFNNFIFAVIGKLAKAMGEDIDTVRAQLLILTERFRMIKITPMNKHVLVPDSMSRGNWTMKQLQEFWDDAREVILEQMLTGLPEAEANEIREMLSQHP